MHHDDQPRIIARNARYGLILFAIYVVLYLGFMLLSVLRPDLMDAEPLGEGVPGAGVNLAILYGFGLIAAALVLALIYMVLCRERGSEGPSPNKPRA